MQAEDKKPDGAQVPSIAELFDEDHVLMFYPSAPGAQFRLGKRNPNSTRGFVIEKKPKRPQARMVRSNSGICRRTR
jgi:hypothetical protein